MRLALLAVTVAVSAAAPGWKAEPGWHSEPAVPVARTEVAAAVSGRELVVAGGYLEDGSTTARTDVYDPLARTWRRGPDLPEPVNHAAATTLKGAAVVVGGYAAGGPTRIAARLDGDAWRGLRSLPAPRAAAAAVALNGRLYVVGGVAGSGLAKTMLRYDPMRRTWTQLRGPTPRQHLAAAAARGRIYAIAGRAAGYDTNTALVESWAPGERRWRREPPIPDARGGTAAATTGGVIVSVGGESPAGTHASVFGFDVATRSWRRLPDLPSPRHGLGAVTFDGRVYVLAGGPNPGLTVTGANDVLSGVGS